jgi:hypothetical protein
MAEADDVYMGYAGRDELLAALNTLLEGSRAGARTALALEPVAPTEPVAALMRAIQRDGSEACALLLGHIRALGGTPSPHIGAAYGKTMMLRDASERIAFLNRELGQMVCRLRTLLPRVRDPALHAALDRILRAFEKHVGDARDALWHERSLRHRVAP